MTRALRARIYVRAAEKKRKIAHARISRTTIYFTNYHTQIVDAVKFAQEKLLTERNTPVI